MSSNSGQNRSIDLNADLGEGCPWDEPLLDRVTSASIACGGHAGSPEIMRATLLLARDRGVIVGRIPAFRIAKDSAAASTKPPPSRSWKSS